MCNLNLNINLVLLWVIIYIYVSLVICIYICEVVTTYSVIELHQTFIKLFGCINAKICSIRVIHSRDKKIKLTEHVLKSSIVLCFCNIEVSLVFFIFEFFFILELIQGFLHFMVQMVVYYKALNSRFFMLSK